MNEKLNIAVGKALGWFSINRICINGRWFDEETWFPPYLKDIDPANPPGGCSAGQRPPNFSGDLNLMREIETAIPFGSINYASYVDELSTIAGCGCRQCNQNGSRDWGSIIHATAAQKAEAFLKMRELWEDEAPAAPGEE